MAIRNKAIPDASCAGCPVHDTANLLRLGVEMKNWDFVVALAGNPNTGKSTVFNALTGLRQHTGNWPGKTVARAEGGFEFDGNRYKVIDLPGTYSLLATSRDEEIARDFILFGRPDVTVIVVDATRLERNLNLVLQVSQITERVVVCLNLMDEADRHGLEINVRRLAHDLNLPVVPTAARRGRGLDLLLTTIRDVATGRMVGKRYQLHNQPAKLKHALGRLTDELQTLYPGLPNTSWLALRLLDGDEGIINAIRTGEISRLADLDRPADSLDQNELGP